MSQSSARLCLCTVSCDALLVGTAVDSAAHACQSNSCESLLFGSQDFGCSFWHLTLLALTQGAIKGLYVPDPWGRHAWVSE